MRMGGAAQYRVLPWMRPAACRPASASAKFAAMKRMVAQSDHHGRVTINRGALGYIRGVLGELGVYWGCIRVYPGVFGCIRMFAGVSGCIRVYMGCIWGVCQGCSWGVSGVHYDLLRSVKGNKQDPAWPAKCSCCTASARVRSAFGITTQYAYAAVSCGARGPAMDASRGLGNPPRAATAAPPPPCCS